jgi:nucleotide-binding universal stress UspA family protein
VSVRPEARVFQRVLCAIDGGPNGDESVRQAAALMGPNGRLTLAPLSHKPGGLEMALKRGRQIARRRGLTASVEPDLEGSSDEDLAQRFGGHDLLAVGGSTQAVARALSLAPRDVPVLLARTPPRGIRFPEKVVVVGDDSPAASRALSVSLQICAEHDHAIALVLGTSPNAITLQAPNAAARELFDELAADRLVINSRTAPHASVVEWAEMLGSSLVIVGSEARTGRRAGASVSERVALRAPCSVLVARRDAAESELVRAA